MYTNILVPLDTSPEAEQILAYLPQLSTAETTIHLVSVIEPNMYAYAFATEEATLQSKLQRVIHSDMEIYLARIGGSLRQQGLIVETWLARGDAAQTIADVATRINADLIAMTTHGRTGFIRWALGSVADRIIHSAQQPIFLSRTQTETIAGYTIRRILVPLDGSKLAEEALAQAKVIAKAHGAELLLIRGVEPLSNWQRTILADDGYNPETMEAERHIEAKQYLNAIRADLESDGIHSVERLSMGGAGDAILQLLTAEPVDLVVMSTHGLSGYSRWVYGSVAGKVLHSAPCPLLLLRSVEMAKSEIPVDLQ